MNLLETGVGSLTVRMILGIGIIGTFVCAARGANKEKTITEQKQVDLIVRSYLNVQQLLAQDKLEGVPGELAKIHDAAQGLSASGDAKVQEHAKAIVKHADVKPKDLKEARAAFKPLSADLIGLVQIVPASDAVAPALYDNYCPMAKADWLSASKEIANPYFGKQMLECGTIKKQIDSASSSEKK